MVLTPIDPAHISSLPDSRITVCGALSAGEEWLHPNRKERPLRRHAPVPAPPPAAPGPIPPPGQYDTPPIGWPPPVDRPDVRDSPIPWIPPDARSPDRLRGLQIVYRVQNGRELFDCLDQAAETQTRPTS